MRVAVTSSGLAELGLSLLLPLLPFLPGEPQACPWQELHGGWLQPFLSKSYLMLLLRKLQG